MRWADEEPLDEVAAEKVARAFAPNCEAMKKSIARLSATAPRPVQPEEEQTRVRDEQACLEQYAPEYWDAITSELLPAALTFIEGVRGGRPDFLGFL